MKLNKTKWMDLLRTTLILFINFIWVRPSIWKTRLKNYNENDISCIDIRPRHIPVFFPKKEFASYLSDCDQFAFTIFLVGNEDPWNLMSWGMFCDSLSFFSLKAHLWDLFKGLIFSLHDAVIWPVMHCASGS